MQPILFVASLPLLLVVEYQAQPDALTLAIVDWSTRTPRVVSELYRATTAVETPGAAGERPEMGATSESAVTRVRWNNSFRPRTESEVWLVESLFVAASPFDLSVPGERRSMTVRATGRLGDLTPGYATLGPMLSDRRAAAHAATAGKSAIPQGD